MVILRYTYCGVSHASDGCRNGWIRGADMNWLIDLNGHALRYWGEGENEDD